MDGDFLKHRKEKFDIYSYIPLQCLKYHFLTINHFVVNVQNSLFSIAYLYNKSIAYLTKYIFSVYYIHGI